MLEKAMRTTVIVVLCLPLLGAGGLASAQEAPKGAKLPEKYTSPMRAQCEAEIQKDHTWRAMARRELAAEVHKKDAEEMLANKKHVVAAYAALWGFTVLFVLFLWLRQRRLVDEIARLEDEVHHAVHVEKGP